MRGCVILFGYRGREFVSVARLNSIKNGVEAKAISPQFTRGKVRIVPEVTGARPETS